MPDADARYTARMRERIRVDMIRCERCVKRLTDHLAPIEGLRDARVEMGTSSIIVEYPDGAQDVIDKALYDARFRIIERETMPDEVLA